MKKFIYPLVALLILVMGYFYLRHPLGEKVTINGHTLSVEVSVTEAEREKGLSDRDSLGPDAGMLFVYQNKDRYGYWMKGMRFPLDYIWIADNTVVDLSPNIPAPTTSTEAPVELAPKVPVNKVLEVNAGVIAQLGIQVGDIVKFSN